MRTLFLITFFAVQTFSLWAIQDVKQEFIEPTREFCQQLIDEAMKESGNKNYAFALEKLLKAELIATENQWEDKLWLVKNLIGQIYSFNSSFAEASEYYEESYSITQKIDSLQIRGSIPLTNMAVLLAKDKNYNEAKDYYEKAFRIAKKDTGITAKAIAVNLAGIYNYFNEPKKSFAILKEVESSGNDSYDFLWEIVYAETLFYDGKIDEALRSAEKLIEDYKSGMYKDYREVCYVCIYRLLSTMYDTPATRKKAIYYIREALKSSDELTDRVYMYKKLVKLYQEENEQMLASKYKDSVIQSTDSLSKKISRNLYEINKVKFKTQEYKNDLTIEKEQKKKQQTLFLIIVAFVLVVSFTIYKGLKNNITKQKQKAVISNLAFEKEKRDRLLAERQIEISNNQALLKQEQLKNNIAQKNRELSAQTLFLTKRNKMIEEIIGTLEGNKGTTQKKEIDQQIKTIKDFLKANRQQKDFIRHFEEVNPLFLKKLKEKHPKLTSNDTRFLCYVYMNLSLKEICKVLSITYNACVIRKQRIMDKMELDKKRVHLYDYLLSISQ